jgi:hypothetical protein
VLSLASEASEALCGELRRAAADEAFWRGRASAGVGSAAVLAHLLEQGPGALLAALRPPVQQPPPGCGALSRPGADMQARLAALRPAVRQAQASLAAVHGAAHPLGAALRDGREASGDDVAALRCASDALPSAANALAAALWELAAAAGAPPALEDAPASAAGDALADARAALRRGRAALDAASEAPCTDAASGYPLGLVPAASRRPGRLRRRWPRYALAAVAAGVAARWLLQRHRSGDLSRWLAEARTAVADAYRDRMVAPLTAVAAEFFPRLRPRGLEGGSTAPLETLEASRASLDRMLADFAHRHAAPAPDAAAAMDVMMRTYEAEVSRPLRGLLAGDLAWALLIQVQKLKTDTEGSMRALEQVLRANELTIALVAALPSLGLVAGAFAALRRLVARAPPAPGAATAALRRCFAAAERALDAADDGGSAVVAGRVLAALDGAHDAAAALMRPETRRGAAVPAAAAAALATQLGVRESAAAQAAQWRAFQADLLALAAPPVPTGDAAAERARKRHTAARMARTYPALANPPAR